MRYKSYSRSKWRFSFYLNNHIINLSPLPLPVPLANESKRMSTFWAQNPILPWHMYFWCLFFTANLAIYHLTLSFWLRRVTNKAHLLSHHQWLWYVGREGKVKANFHVRLNIFYAPFAIEGAFNLHSTRINIFFTPTPKWYANWWTLEWKFVVSCVC